MVSAVAVYSTEEFKNSELGPIPADWDLAQLNSLVDPDRSIRYGIVQPGRFDPFGRYMIRGQDYSKGWVDSAELFRVSDIVERVYRNARVKPGDILITIVGASTGHIAIVPDWLDGANLTQTTARIAIQPMRANGLYCAYMLESSYGETQTLNYMKGGAQPGLNCGDVEKFFIPLPPTIEEQEDIARVLSDVDALIEALEGLLAKKRSIKQGAMQDLLTGKKRLPGFNGKWEMKSLGDLGEVLIGLTYTPSDVSTDGTLVLRSSNVSDGVLCFDDNVYVTASVPDRIMVRSGDILICVRNGSRDLIGKCAKIDESCHGMTFGAFMAVYRTPFHDFLYHQFQSDILKRQVHEHLGATINQITNKSLRSFAVPYPVDEEERTAIAEILTAMDSELSGLSMKLAKALKIRKGMMTELLTGRVRLL
jgi:type I restriction enzyme S subunit